MQNLASNKPRISKNIDDLTIPRTIFNPCIPYSKCTFLIDEETQESHKFRSQNQLFTVRNVLKSELSSNEVNHGYNRSLVTQLKSKKNKGKAKKSPIKAIKGFEASTSTTYNNIQPGVVYVMNAKLTKKVMIQFPKKMLVSPHLYSHLKTIEPECQIVISDHVTHIKKKQSKGGETLNEEDMECDSP
jgi:hypothetical protein